MLEVKITASHYKIKTGKIYREIHKLYIFITEIYSY